MLGHFCSVWVLYFITCRRSVNTHLFIIYIFAYRKRFETKIKSFSSTKTRDFTKFLEISKFCKLCNFNGKFLVQDYLRYFARNPNCIVNENFASGRMYFLFEGQRKPKVCFYFFNSCNYLKFIWIWQDIGRLYYREKYSRGIAHSMPLLLDIQKKELCFLQRFIIVT